MVIRRGAVWWADLGTPTRSGLGFRRPVGVVLREDLNRSPIGTLVCIPVTSNLRWPDAPGNVHLLSRVTGLPKDSVANVSQIVAIDKSALTDRVGKLPRVKQDLLLAGIDVVLGRVSRLSG